MTGATTLSALLAAASARLAEAGLEEPRREARALAVAALGLSREVMVARPDLAVGGDERACFERALARRAAREPLARIVGAREFWSLDIRLVPEALVPRPETETVVEAVLDSLPDRRRPLSILDLGTGSGCILLALLTELPAARGLGIDVLPGAVACAEDNAKRLGLAGRARFRVGDWGEGLSGPFDVIVSNPPYLPDGVRDSLPPEVRRFDPPRALHGGADGLAAYRGLAPHLGRLLAPDGFAAVELGAGQGRAVAAVLAAAGLAPAAAREDLAGHERVLLARPAPLTKPSSDAKKSVGKDRVPV